MKLFIKMNNKRTTINNNKCFHTLDVNLAGAFFNFICGLWTQNSKKIAILANNDRPVRFRLAKPTRCRPPRFNFSWSNFDDNNFGLYAGGVVHCCCCCFFPWSVAAELEQLGAPYVVFPDMIVGGFICLAICIFLKNKPQFWQKIHITIPQLMAVANPAYIQIAWS